MDRAVLHRRCRSRPLLALLAVQPRQTVDRPRPVDRPGPVRAPGGVRRHRHRLPAPHRRRPGRVGRVPAPRSAVDHHPGHSVRRRRPVGGLPGLRPRPSRARGSDDELRVRPATGRHVRRCPDSAPGVARLPHRRRADRDGTARGAGAPGPHGRGAGPVVRGPRGRVEEHRARPHELGDAPCPAAPADVPARVRAGVVGADHSPDQGRTVVRADARGAPRPVGGAAVPGALRHGGKRRADRRGPGAGPDASDPGRRGGRRERRKAPRGRAATVPQVHVRLGALARGPGGRADLCPSAAAARECRGRSLAGPGDLQRGRASGTGPVVHLRHEQVGVGPGLGRRPARPAPQRGPRRDTRRTRAVTTPITVPAPRVGRMAVAAGPGRPGASPHRQAHGAHRRADPGLRLVPRIGRRDAVPRGHGRREHKGRVARAPRHAPGSNGSGRRARRPREGRRAAPPGSPTPTWAGSTTTRTPANGASLSTSAIRGDSSWPRSCSGSPTSSPRVSRPACSTSGVWATT